MAVFIVGGVVIGAGVVAVSTIMNKKHRARTAYQCGKHAAEVANETEDKDHGWQEGKAELMREGIHYSSTSLRNCLSFRQGFNEHYQHEEEKELVGAS